jgi:hypothetical protein
MNDPHDLRKKAARARWAATVRTEGGHEADLQLTAFAENLEQEAEEQEYEKAKTKDRPRW